MKNKIKVFGLSLGMTAMSFAFFVGNPTYAQEGLPGEGEDDWICCQHPWGTGCTDKGGVQWPDDIRINGSQPTCTGISPA